ncbi:MAG: ABC transporter ATP-binding protein [Thermomicrobiales bacterium]|nr:ABC transporter ATP-binding protein [Thermomicrobiales bacterium]
MSNVEPTVSTGIRLAAVDATLGYDQTIVLDHLTAEIPDGAFVAIIGPNGCGKSTLLRTFARVLHPATGQVLLDGKTISGYRTKEVARTLGLLPQTSLAPEGIRVADLVARGRAPHQGIFSQWSRADEEAVAAALAATRLTELSGHLVDELSGGQRQRVWIALLLAQQTPILLLDEPTTFLDIAHQYELLDLFRTLHEDGKTIVAVMHDINQAARYADHLIVMHNGAVVTTGRPAEIITAGLLAEVFNLPALVVPDPVTGTPTVVPLDSRSAPRSAIASASSIAG